MTVQPADWPSVLRLRRHLREIEAATPPAERRLLAVWDFREAPFNIGDILILHQRMELLRFEHDLDKVDYAFVLDPERIGSHNPLYEAGVTADNCHGPLPGLLRAVQASAHAGSVFFFDSHAGFERFLATQLDRYEIWPGAHAYDQPQHAYGRCFDAVQDFHVTHGWYPKLTLRPALRRWAARFLLEHVWPAVPVVIQPRNNRRRPNGRNAALEVWEAFLRHCAEGHDARFVLIGAAAEIDPRFRELPNVIVAKDHGTSLEQDLALAQQPAIFLGSPSGPTVMAIFSDRPYVIFNHQPNWDTVDTTGRWSFAAPDQRLTFQPETLPEMIAEFDALWANLDRDDYHRTLTAAAGNGLGDDTWLLWDRT